MFIAENRPKRDISKIENFPKMLFFVKIEI